MNATAKLSLVFALSTVAVGLIGIAVKGSAAVTALYVGGGFALFILLIPFLMAMLGKASAAKAGFILGLVLLVATLGRAIPTWKKVMDGASEKTFTAGLMSALALICLVFAFLYKGRSAA